MLFHSLPFLYSFLLFYIFYRWSSLKWQNYLLFGFGFFFYAYWSFGFGLLLLGSITCNYFLGIGIGRKKSANPIISKNLFLGGIIGNLILLFVFKYAVFSGIMLEDLYNLFTSRTLKLGWNLLLPIGISFYTFHNISYLVEVYKGRIQFEKNWIHFAIYDLFFPLLLAGPIERPNTLLPQIQNPRHIQNKEVLNGSVLFLQGVIWKSLFSDPLATYTDSLVQNLDDPGILWVAAVGFAFQVYADFCGYSLCAMGLAQIMGFRLMKNFHRPFFATSPAEFWRRWHISLSTWLRDYVYIPLGGNQNGFTMQCRNILLVWFLGGLWHGATYGYMIWGIYLGICLVAYLIWKRTFAYRWFHSSPVKEGLANGLGRSITFLSFALGLLLFRVESPKDFGSALTNLMGFSSDDLFSILRLAVFFSPILMFDSWQAYKKTENVDWSLQNRPLVFSLALLVFLPAFLLFSPFQKQEFFYFQF